MGYSTISDPDRFGLSLVLGGGEVTPLDHAAAYSIFANGGLYYEPVSVLKVEDSNREIIKEWKKPEDKRVIEKDLASLISNVLSDDAARSYIFFLG